MSFCYEIDLSPHTVGQFDLKHLNLGYRYSPWKEENGAFSQGLLCGDRAVKVVVGGGSRGALLRVRSQEELLEKEVEVIVDKVLFCLGLKDDLTELTGLGEDDPHLREALDALPGYRLKATPTVYEAILSAMISQNCSRDAFFSMLSQFRRSFGRIAEIEGQSMEAFPTPEEVVEGDLRRVEDPRLRYRMTSIGELARVLTKDFLNRLEGLPPDEGIEELEKLRGIGGYTARVVQLYGMRRYEVGFFDGYVQKLIGRLYLKKEKPRPREVLQFMKERWGSWQGYALDVIIAYAQLRDFC